MSTNALEEHLENAQPALPDSEYSLSEKIALWAVLVLIAAVVSGLVLANETVWD